MLAYLKIPFIFFIVLFLSLSSIGIEIVWDDTIKKRRLRAYQTHLCSKFLLLILGVKMEVKEGDRFSLSRSNLIVANHLSYLDVFILSAIVPTVFVTSKEVEESGFLGFISKSSGALFVERRKRTQLNEEIGTVKAILEEGMQVGIFPEGTTSSGEGVLPFKSTFFDAAVRSGCHVLPVCINYKKVNSRDITSVEKDLLFYYGTMEFFPHFFKLLSLSTIEVDVIFDSPITVPSHFSRKELSSYSYSKIVSHYLPVV